MFMCLFLYGCILVFLKLRFIIKLRPKGYLLSFIYEDLLQVVLELYLGIRICFFFFEIFSRKNEDSDIQIHL
jgi:hypothetical protein